MNNFRNIIGTADLSQYEIINIHGGQTSPEGPVQVVFYYLHAAVDHAAGGAIALWNSWCQNSHKIDYNYL